MTRIEGISSCNRQYTDYEEITENARESTTETSQVSRREDPEDMDRYYKNPVAEILAEVNAELAGRYRACNSSIFDVARDYHYNKKYTIKISAHAGQQLCLNDQKDQDGDADTAEILF